MDDDVRHVAVHEQFAGQQADDLVGRDAAVGAADPQITRRLLTRQLRKEIRVTLVDAARPRAVVGEQRVEADHAQASSDRNWSM